MASFRQDCDKDDGGRREEAYALTRKRLPRRRQRRNAQYSVLVLPSIEEDSALVTYVARASGCVLLVSDAAGAML